MTNLKYNYLSANYSKENRHAQTVMKELGITYSDAIPETIADSWFFIDCKNIPDNLPKFITETTYGTD